MSDVKWIKISTSIFDDEKFDAIRTMPDGNDIQLVWFKLLCLAGRCNENGFLMLTRELPYTDEMLASHFRMDVGVVQRALSIFQKLEMVEVIDNIYMVSNWAKHQSADRLDEIRRKDRERKRLAKEKQVESAKEIEEKTDSAENPRKFHGDCSSSSSESEVLCLGDSYESNNTNNLNNESINSNSHINTINRIIDAWNLLSDIGIKPIRSVTQGSKRNEMLRARIREYGEDAVLEAIENIRKSDFLQGKNNRGWMITFDWFILPSNFPKVLEGNYDNPVRGKNSYNKGNKELRGADAFMAIAIGDL